MTTLTRDPARTTPAGPARGRWIPRLGGPVWLVWRQHRAAFWTLLGATVVGVIVMVHLRGQMMDYLATQDPTSRRSGGLPPEFEAYADPLFDIGSYLSYIPVLAGVFLGAPLFAGDLETGTAKLVTSQSVSSTAVAHRETRRSRRDARPVGRMSSPASSPGGGTRSRGFPAASSGRPSSVSRASCPSPTPCSRSPWAWRSACSCAARWCRWWSHSASSWRSGSSGTNSGGAWGTSCRSAPTRASGPARYSRNCPPRRSSRGRAPTSSPAPETAWTGPPVSIRWRTTGRTPRAWSRSTSSAGPSTISPSPRCSRCSGSEPQIMLAVAAAVGAFVILWGRKRLL